MATNGCPFVQFIDIYEDAFYFGGPGKDEDVDEDAARIQCFIRSEDNKFLILNEKYTFEAKSLTIHEQSQHACKFYIHTYSKNNHCSMDQNEGRKVILYINKDGKNMVACCCESGIYPEEMNPPDIIGEGHCKAVFLLKKVPQGTDKYMFESCMYKKRFLGFESDKNNSGLDKLVLRQKVDEVDEACQMVLKTSS